MFLIIFLNFFTFFRSGVVSRLFFIIFFYFFVCFVAVVFFYNINFLGVDI
jgi:hypothetical protein